METLLPIIVQIVTGVIGGQAVGAAVKQAAMGQLGKILSGAIGGVAGGAILNSVLGGSVDPGAVAQAAQGLGSSLNLSNIVGGAGGGAILTAIVGAVMNATKK
ncbi:MAG: hypothetical protein WA975_02615 [Mesorhizobium sp.]|nr:hypothetical protein [Mesorhizobium sp.]